jgi:hypothetical protein
MPRLRAMRPVRIDSGVHVGGSEAELCEAVALFAAVEDINLFAAATPRCGRRVQSLSIVNDRRQEYLALNESQCNLLQTLISKLIKYYQSRELLGSLSTHGMDYCPTRYERQNSSYKKGKAYDAKTTVSRVYPLAEQGSVVAANLIRHGRRLDWTFLGQNDSGIFQNCIHYRRWKVYKA